MVSPSRGADALIIGDGLIGLSTALELGRTGAKVIVVGTARPGVASVAAAGLLVPSVGHLPDAVRPFFLDSLARYPSFIERLRPHDATLAMIKGLVERGTHGELVLAREGRCEEEIADVRAGDEQDHHHGCLQQQEQRPLILG